MSKTTDIAKYVIVIAGAIIILAVYMITVMFIKMIKPLSEEIYKQAILIITAIMMMLYIAFAVIILFSERYENKPNSSLAKSYIYTFVQKLR